MRRSVGYLIVWFFLSVITGLSWFAFSRIIPAEQPNPIAYLVVDIWIFLLILFFSWSAYSLVQELRTEKNETYYRVVIIGIVCALFF